MVAPALLLTLLMGATVQPDTEANTHIALRDDALRITDIAIVSREDDRVIARLPRRAASLSLTEEQRRTLLRNRVPGGQFRLRHAGTVRIERGAIERAAHELRGPCYAARTDLAAGSYLDRSAVTEVACKPRTSDRRLGYDAAARTPRVDAPIAAATYLGRLRLGDRAPVSAGKSMVLRTTIGPVTVERAVTSLQPGWHGKRLFVRTDEGELLASTLDDIRSPEGR